MLWDDKYLYIAAELEEPNVTGTLTKHDSVIFKDNDFEVFIKPLPATESYYEFEINALNTGWDLFLPKPYSEDGKADNSWDIVGLKTAVAVQGTLNHSATPTTAGRSRSPIRSPPSTPASTSRRRKQVRSGASTSAASNGRPAIPRKTTGSGRRRASSTCTCPIAGAICTSASRKQRLAMCFAGNMG